MKFDLSVLGADGETRTCEASWVAVRPHELYELLVNVPGLPRQRRTGGDLFECLCELRRHIEPRGWRVLCQGARKDVWPSGMARDMGEGRKVYVLRHKPLGPNDLVETFAPAGAAEVATLAEQRAFASGFFGSAV